MHSFLRPDPERGSLIGAGAAALVLTVFVLNARFEEEWGVGIHLVYSAAAAALVIALALSAANVAGSPPGWQSILFIASFVLGLIALANLADVLGTEGDLSSGTVVWIGVLLAALMFKFASDFDSGISTLLGAVTVVVVVVAFVDWVFSPDGAGTYRWILLFTALALAAFAQMARGGEPHHGVGFVNAAGLALLGIAITYGIESIEGLFGGSVDVDAGTGWELVLLLGGAALIAYAITASRSGPGYLGVANLLAFLLLSAGASDDGASLVGWPLLLLLVTAGLLVLALRRDAPPGGPGPPATAAGAPPTPSTPATEDTTQIHPKQ